MWRALLIFLSLSALADETSLTIAPEGVAVKGGDRNLGFSAGEGGAQMNFSLTGNPPMYQAPVQYQNSYGSNVNPAYVTKPSNALTDSDAFFKSIGKDYELPKEHRHRRKDAE